MSCKHHQSCDPTKKWFWGYVHASGELKIKRLQVSPEHQAECDLCHAMSEKDHPGSLISAITTEPVQEEDWSKAQCMIAYNLGRFVGQAIQRGDKVFTSQFDRFELIEIE